MELIGGREGAPSIAPCRRYANTFYCMRCCLDLCVFLIYKGYFHVTFKLNMIYYIKKEFQKSIGCIATFLEVYFNLFRVNIRNPS